MPILQELQSAPGFFLALGGREREAAARAASTAAGARRFLSFPTHCTASWIFHSASCMRHHNAVI